MNKEEIFATWAPDTSVWSPWVKPVLFAYLDMAAPVTTAYHSPEAPASLPALPVAEPVTGAPQEHGLGPSPHEPQTERDGPLSLSLSPSEGERVPKAGEGLVHGLKAQTGSGNSLPEAAMEMDWVPAIETRTVLVLDLPGAEGVRFGLELAARGYRPVPLYTAVPASSGEPLLDLITGRPVAAVHVLPILQALKKGAASLGLTDLPPDTPPVFLLDAHRRGGGRKMLPDEFDNRSVCFTTDFPSANFLSAQRIGCVVLVQRSGEQPQLDLAHVLRRWQKSGIAIQLKTLDAPSPPVPCEIRRPSWFGAMFQRALSMVGLHYGEAGGFGGWVTDTSAGG